MESTNPPTSTDQSPQHQSGTPELPPGDHALEVAARAGIGPLSPLGAEVWHGESKPCVSCGQLVRRGTMECDHCEQDLRDEMVEKMRLHAGPWYVHEHVRPFPGVSLERIIRQVRRGLISPTSIVRGPDTDHQWRFAAETPGLCRYFGKCWHCQQAIEGTQTHCASCHSHLTFEQTRSSPGQSPSPEVMVEDLEEEFIAVEAPRGSSSGELAELSAAIYEADLPTQEPVWDEPPSIGGVRATWVVLAVLVVVMGALVVLTQTRTEPVRSTNEPVPVVSPAKTAPTPQPQTNPTTTGDQP